MEKISVEFWLKKTHGCPLRPEELPRDGRPRCIDVHRQCTYESCPIVYWSTEPIFESEK